MGGTGGIPPGVYEQPGTVGGSRNDLDMTSGLTPPGAAATPTMPPGGAAASASEPAWASAAPETVNLGFPTSPTIYGDPNPAPVAPPAPVAAPAAAPAGLTAEQVDKQIADKAKAEQDRMNEQVYVPLPPSAASASWLMGGGGQMNGVNLPKGLDMWNVYGHIDPKQQYATPQGSTGMLPAGMKAGDVVGADMAGKYPTMTRALYDFNMRSYGNPWGPQNTVQAPVRQDWASGGGG